MNFWNIYDKIFIISLIIGFSVISGVLFNIGTTEGVIVGLTMLLGPIWWLIEIMSILRR